MTDGHDDDRDLLIRAVQTASLKEFEALIRCHGSHLRTFVAVRPPPLRPWAFDGKGAEELKERTPASNDNDLIGFGQGLGRNRTTRLRPTSNCVKSAAARCRDRGQLSPSHVGGRRANCQRCIKDCDEHSVINHML